MCFCYITWAIFSVALLFVLLDLIGEGFDLVMLLGQFCSGGLEYSPSNHCHHHYYFIYCKLVMEVFIIWEFVTL